MVRIEGTVKDIAELINAIAALAWPLIVGIVVWRLFPVIKEIARSRGFTVNIGGAELTVQEISEKLLESTAVIQGRLASAPPEEPEALPDRYLRRVLWVDDVPANNAYEVAQLEALGVEVIRALSTGEGMAALRGATVPFDAVISDMSREEDGFYNRDAGLDLAREMRGRGTTGRCSSTDPAALSPERTKYWRPAAMVSPIRRPRSFRCCGRSAGSPGRRMPDRCPVSDGDVHSSKVIPSSWTNACSAVCPRSASRIGEGEH
nr:hypothetical protein GCM10020093_050180 [Planobispora longispora]